MFESVEASDVFAIALIVLLALTAVRWVVSRSTVKGPKLPVPRPTLDAATIRTVSDLVAQDKRIEAIKRLRDATGLGLRETKEWVDGWDPGTAATGPPADVAPTADAAVLNELAIGARAVRDASGGVHAIKWVREQTGWGLADAKKYVDRLE